MDLKRQVKCTPTATDRPTRPLFVGTEMGSNRTDRSTLSPTQPRLLADWQALSLSTDGGSYKPNRRANLLTAPNVCA